MLNRAALPLLRRRAFATPLRFAPTISHFRSYARDHRGNKSSDSPVAADGASEWQRRQYEELGRSHRSPREPLRTVEGTEHENIHPQPINHASRIKNPIDAPTSSPGRTRQTRTDPSSDDPSLSSDPSFVSRHKQTAAGSSSTLPPKGEYVNSEPQQPTRPLPDLTKGIPSTFEAEFSASGKGATRQQYSAEPTEDKFNVTEDPERPPPGPSGSGGGELPRSAYVSSSDRRRDAAVKYVYLCLTLGITGYLFYLGRNWDTAEEEKQNSQAPNGWSPGLMYNRIRARLGSTVSYYSDPVSTKLLPDEDPDPNMRAPFVLVLSLEGLLVHSEWSRQTGWRMAKRPGLDYFLKYLSQYYEIILFTTQPSYIGEQIWRKLDPYGGVIIRYPLFREHSLYKDGGYVKDLSYLNRDLKKVVIMDTDPHHVQNQPENAIVLPKWTGDPNDQTLIQFIPVLEYLATMPFDDARVFLKSFEGKYIPAEFAEREKRLRERFEQEQAQKGGSRGRKGFSMGSLLGASRPQQGAGIDVSSVGSDGKMIWDQIREAGQKHYLEMEARIQKEGASWIAELEANEKKAQEEMMGSMRSGMFGWFGSKKPEGKDSK